MPLSVFHFSEDVKSIYVMAASEIAIHGTSMWQQLLSLEDLQVLEYAADLKVFHYTQILKTYMFY